jgi:putative metalloprotease
MAAFLVLIVFAVVLGFIQWRVSLISLRRMLKEKSLPLRDAELEAMVAHLGEAAGAPELKARLFDVPVVNGLATPDGQVFLTTGLYDKHRLGIIRADEIASVVAHEMGHLALGHHQRRLIDWSGQNAVRLALGLILNRFLPIIGFYIASVISAMALARLSRRDEFEADRYATALMLKAGLNPDAQVSMFRKLERMSPGPRGAAWLASHPPIDDRVAAIKANVAAWTASAA